MSWLIVFSIAAVLAASLVTTVLLINTWNNRYAPGARAFSVMMLLNIGWLLGSTVQVHSQSEEFIYLVFRLTFLFVTLVPVAFFLFAHQFTHSEHEVNLKMTALLLIFPAVSQIVIWTNHLHHLAWSDFQLIRFGVLTAVEPVFGPWFRVHVFYSYFLLLAGLAMMINNTLKNTILIRRQNLLIISGFILTMIVNALFAFKVFPGISFDLTPLLFAFFSPVIVFGLMRFHVFDLIPIHRASLIDGISDGILVVDRYDRITDLNPAACRILDLDPKASFGKDISSSAPSLQPWLKFHEIKTWQQPQVKFLVDGSTHYYNLRISTVIQKKNGAALGRMIILRNITRLKESEMAERAARETAEERSAELEALHLFAGTLNKASTLKEAASTGLPVLLRYVDAEAAWLILRRHLESPLLAAVHTRHGPLDSALLQDIEPAFPGYEHLFTSDDARTLVDPCPLAEVVLGKNTPYRHLCIPLHVSGRLQGSLHLLFTQDSAHQTSRKDFYATIAQQLSAAVERTCLFEDIQQLAIKDPLTGLFNRRHFTYLAERELRRAKRLTRPLSLMMLDLDHFKEVNDLYGHLTGDRILKEIAARCQSVLRELDLLARYGGEEFIFLLPECDFNRAMEVAERLRSCISGEPFLTQKDLIWVTASIGVTATPSDEEKSLENLIQEADQSLYSAKSSGRNLVKA